MEHMVTIDYETIWGSGDENAITKHTHTHVITLHFRKMNMLLVSCYILEACSIIWLQYKLVCENLSNMPSLHQIWIHFQRHLPIYVLVEI
jgi:hypothetical protein